MGNCIVNERQKAMSKPIIHQECIVNVKKQGLTLARVLEKLVSSLHVIKAIRACRLVGVNVKEPSSGQKNKLLLLPRLHA